MIEQSTIIENLIDYKKTSNITLDLFDIYDLDSTNICHNNIKINKNYLVKDNVDIFDEVINMYEETKKPSLLLNSEIVKQEKNNLQKIRFSKKKQNKYKK
jgi:hypothetical protein